MKMRAAFIISPSYSGSTLLSILLAGHPRIVTLGEFLNTRTRKYRHGEGNFCSCGEELTSCPFIERLTGELRSQGLEFSVDFPDTAFRSSIQLVDRILRPYVRGSLFESARRTAIALLPAARREISRIATRNETVISTLLRMQGASIYLDSSKDNGRILFFDRYAPSIGVRCFYLVRDGRGVVTSIMRHTGVNIAIASQRWVTAQQSVMRTVAMFPRNRVMRMSYEELCTAPEKAMNDACQFLELDPALLPAELERTDLHLTGNNMRLGNVDEIRLDLRWKKYLTSEDLRVFGEIAGSLNRQLGYGNED